MEGFNVSYQYSFLKADEEYDNVSANKVLEIFNNINWLQNLNDCNNGDKEHEDFFFLVKFTDENQLEYSLGIELYLDFENSNKQQNFLSFSVIYSFKEVSIKQQLFGLLKDKHIIDKKTIINEPQDFEFVLKCLNSFIDVDFEFLKIQMNNN